MKFFSSFSDDFPSAPSLIWFSVPPTYMVTSLPISANASGSVARGHSSNVAIMRFMKRCLRISNAIMFGRPVECTIPPMGLARGHKESDPGLAPTKGRWSQVKVGEKKKKQRPGGGPEKGALVTGQGDPLI